MNKQIVRSAVSESPLEELLEKALKEFGLQYKQQYPVSVYFADFCFPDKNLILEVDGVHWHDTERDKFRDKRLKELGWNVERYPGWFVWKHSRVIAAKIAYQQYGIDNDLVRGAIATYSLLINEKEDAIKIAKKESIVK